MLTFPCILGKLLAGQAGMITVNIHVAREREREFPCVWPSRIGGQKVNRGLVSGIILSVKVNSSSTR